MCSLFVFLIIQSNQIKAKCREPSQLTHTYTDTYCVRARQNYRRKKQRKTKQSKVENTPTYSRIKFDSENNAPIFFAAVLLACFCFRSWEKFPYMMKWLWCGFMEMNFSTPSNKTEQEKNVCYAVCTLIRSYQDWTSGKKWNRNRWIFAQWCVCLCVRVDVTESFLFLILLSNGSMPC